LGRLLVAAGRDRAVIADERTRRAMGVAGGWPSRPLAAAVTEG